MLILRKLALANPDGLLFKSDRGQPWIRQTCNFRLQRACRKLDDVRHSWATHALAIGLTADLVAELMGNTPAIVAKYYRHLKQKADALRDAARRAIG